MSRSSRRGPSAPNTALVASLSLGAAMAGGPAFAQLAADPAPVAVPEVSVTGTRPANQLQVPTGNPRMPGTIQDTPQTINVVPQEVLREQNVTTLEQALRNVPGITSTIGEGNGGVSGDQFRIRGFSAQNDVLIDGLRDFGSYQRDAFTYEDVQVLKGASGFAMGTSAIGGGINVNSRLPMLENRYAATVTGGMGPYARATADINQRISETIAMRLNVMGQSSSLVDRDEQDTRRWGIAPSIAFGLGTPTTFSVEYLHYQDRHTIDGGTPVVTPFMGRGRPAPEFGLDRSLFFGVRNDLDDVTVDRVTARFSHRFNEWLTINNDTRYSHVDRTTALTPLSCAGSTGSTANRAAFDASCSGQFLSGGNPLVTPGGPGPYTQTVNGVQNLTTALARFRTGPLRHELTAGVDIQYEQVERDGRSYVPGRPSFRLRDPLYMTDTLATGPVNNHRETSSTNFGLFLNERLYLTDQISVFGGFRWTNYRLDYEAGAPGAALTQDYRIRDNYFDPRAGVIFEPTPSQTYYYSYSTSTTPPGTFFTTIPAQAGTFHSSFEPERNTTHEVGAKVSLLDNRLGLTAALFHSEKGNALAQDATDPSSVVPTSDAQRIRGLEIGITGRVTPEWNINAAYTALDSETTSSRTAAYVGRRVQFVPRHAASLWTTYDFAQDTPWNVTVGAGIIYRGQVFLNQDNTAEAPANFSFDAMIQHKLNQNVTLRVNGYNLTDRTNYEGLFGNRAVVAAGRTVLFSVAAEF